MKKFILASASYSNKRGNNIILSQCAPFTKEQIKLIKQAHDEYQKIFTQARLDMDEANGAIAKRKINNKFQTDMNKLVSEELKLTYNNCYLIWREAEFILPFIDKDEFLR